MAKHKIYQIKYTMFIFFYHHDYVFVTMVIWWKINTHYEAYMYSCCSNRINLKIKFIPPWMDMKWKTSIPFIVFIFSRANIRNLSISRLFISSNFSRMWWATLSRWTDILPLCKTSNHKLLDATNTNFIILDRHCDINEHLNLCFFL